MASSTQHPQEIVFPISYLLSQVAASVRSGAPDATVKVSSHTTWTEALQTAVNSLESNDQQLTIFPQQTEERQQALKQTALSTVSTSATVSSKTSDAHSQSEPISQRTSSSSHLERHLQ